MKKLGILIATIALSTGVSAENPSEQRGLTVAAAEVNTQVRWELPKSKLKSRTEALNLDFERRAQELNESISAQLDERMNEKLERRLQAKF